MHWSELPDHSIWAVGISIVEATRKNRRLDRQAERNYFLLPISFSLPEHRISYLPTTVNQTAFHKAVYTVCLKRLGRTSRFQRPKHLEPKLYDAILILYTNYLCILLPLHRPGETTKMELRTAKSMEILPVNYEQWLPSQLRKSTKIGLTEKKLMITSPKKSGMYAKPFHPKRRFLKYLVDTPHAISNPSILRPLTKSNHFTTRLSTRTRSRNDWQSGFIRFSCITLSPDIE